MELRHLRYALAVAEHGHFGRAARALDMAQPPLSRQIGLLEQELGARVFDRTAHGVVPTAAGQVYLAHARRVLAELDDGIAETRRAARGQTGTLGLGFIASALVTPLPALLPRWRASHPGVRLECRELSTHASTSALLAGEIDVAVCRGGPSGAGAEHLAAVPIGHDHVVLLVHHAHPFASRESVGWPQLRGEPLVIGTAEDEPAVLDELGHLLDDLDPALVTRARDVHTIAGLVACGVGVAPLPSGVRALDRPGTRVVGLDPVRRLPDLYLVSRADDVSPVLAAFLDLALPG